MKTVALAVAVVNNQKLFSPRKYYKYQEPQFLCSSIEKELGRSLKYCRIMAPFYFDSIYKSVLLVFKTVNYTSLKSNDVCTDQV